MEKMENEMEAVIIWFVPGTIGVVKTVALLGNTGFSIPLGTHKEY